MVRIVLGTKRPVTITPYLGNEQHYLQWALL